MAFNILDHISFQTVAQVRLKLNYTNPRLESSAQFYPVRIARLWNALTIDLRLSLTSQLPLSQIKVILNRFYKDRLLNYFDTDNLCTWVMACRCRLCRT